MPSVHSQPTSRQEIEVLTKNLDVEIVNHWAARVDPGILAA
jgi:hypothetical protein